MAGRYETQACSVTVWGHLRRRHFVCRRLVRRAVRVLNAQRRPKEDKVQYADYAECRHGADPTARRRGTGSWRTVLQTTLALGPHPTRILFSLGNATERRPGRRRAARSGEIGLEAGAQLRGCGAGLRSESVLARGAAWPRVRRVCRERRSCLARLVRGRRAQPDLAERSAPRAARPTTPVPENDHV